MSCVLGADLVKETASENKVTLHLKRTTTIPIEADSISPDFFVHRNRAEIEALPAFYGRRKVALGDLFTVDGERSDSIIVEGDLSHVKKIGQGMTIGRITLSGDAGPHLGANMRGGEITVRGNANDWAGAQMQGGRIWIKGNAGHHVGAAYPGEKHGVNRGMIIIEGNAGRELGAGARRTLIVALGNVGEFAGANMIAGSIFVFGRLGERAGAGMKRGSIVVFGESADLLPTFRYECRFQPVFVRFYLHRLHEWGLPVPLKRAGGFFRRYSGDMTSSGKGEILIYDQREEKL
ncbi:MAG: formylmethanofuran dehydrogenase subunit C [Smithellaceae bacterium]|nr:formylmethanofuran dehydrogenase subunit C [Smithellaceae bacterium]